MNQKKFSKIFQSLLGAGVSVNDATKSAAKLANKVEKTSPAKPAKKSKLSVNDQILEYATSRRGNVWTLQSLALALPKISYAHLTVNITGLTKKGKIVRVGRGEYRKAH